MEGNSVLLGVKMPLSVVKRLDVLMRVKGFSSRSAIILRACEFYLSKYYFNSLAEVEVEEGPK